MRTALISLVVAGLLCGGAAAIFEMRRESSYSAAQEEVSGVNPRSRKYFEYLRHANAEGVVPTNMEEAVLEFASRLPKKDEGRSLNWQARGPFNKGGRSRALAIDVTNDQHILAGSVTGGMWSSLNGGASWVKTSAPEQMQSTSCVVQDRRPGHENTWYFGTGEEFYGVVSGTSFTSLYSGDGIFKSTDGGQSWTQLASTASGTPQDVMVNGSYDFVWNMVVDHTNLEQDEVYAAVYNGIIRSLDGGETWEQVLGFQASPCEFTDIIITPQGVLYAAFSDNSANTGGFYRSLDGVSWTMISPPIESMRRTVMDYNPQNENEVYFLGESFDNIYPVGHFLYKYTYVSGDGSGTGGILEDRTANLPDEPCSLFIGVDFDFGTFRSQNGFDLCIAHHPTQPVIFIGGINIHRGLTAFSTDESSWIGGYRCNQEEPWYYSYPNHHSDQHRFVFSPTNPNVMYNANDGGIYRTDNCLEDSVTWVPLNNGYLTTQFYTVGVEEGQSNSDFVFGGMQDNGTWMTHSADPLLSWKEVHADDGAFAAMPRGRDYMVTSSQAGKMMKKLIDDQGNLVATERIDPENGPSYLFINPFILDPWNQNDLYMAGNKSIWYLHNVSDIPVTGNYVNKLDSGWTSINASNIPFAAGSITCLDKALIDNTKVYYGTSAAKAYRLDDCFGNPVRTNITGNWGTSGYVSCITTNDFNVQEVMLSFSNYNRPSIYHSLDNGTNWEDVSGNLEQNLDGTGNGPAVYWVEIYPSEPAIYFAATSAGLYSTSLLDGENTIWEQEGANTIGNVVVNMVKARPFDGKIVVGTHANGIYSSSLPPVEAASIPSYARSNAEVSVYPNPFADWVSWKVQAAANEKITIDIYSIAGDWVDRIERTSGNSPSTILTWSPKQKTLGTYIYKMEFGGKIKTGKIICEAP
jgi:hypothetical protein